jgi:hypothetical protein
MSVATGDQHDRKKRGTAMRPFENRRERTIGRYEPDMTAGSAEMRLVLDGDEARRILREAGNPDGAFRATFVGERHPGDLCLHGRADRGAARADVAARPDVEPLLDRVERAAITGTGGGVAAGMRVRRQGMHHRFVDVAPCLSRKLPSRKLRVLFQHRVADGAALPRSGDRLGGEHAGDRQ